jgi:murein DD-endopeptidase MepM/ murein hydrolase activator NlpD
LTLDLILPPTTPDPVKKPWPIKPQTARIVLYAVLLLAMIGLWRAMRPPAPATTAATMTSAAPISSTQGAPTGTTPSSAPSSALAVALPLAAQHASVSSLLEIIVGRNDTLDSIFRKAALNLSDLAAIRRLPGIRQSLDILRPGDAIKVSHTDGDVRELTRKVSETQTMHVVRDDAGFTVQMVSNPVEVRTRTATARIDSSLFQAADAAQISDNIALKLANVFAWDIDFVLDIREGDRFTAVYEQIYQDGKYLHDGDVLAAEFVNNGKTYRAVRFVSDSGSVGYYTPNGLAMRKAFLRAPVEFSRVSSAFNPHRLHPILNTIRGHMGTDYAAPTGTPVHAAGDGRVSFAGVRGGYGNALELAHGGNVSTLYGHMSHFARNIHVGTHVQQGEVIGYVGMTGLATGPHLHYEFIINGVHKNPQTVQLPGAEPLRASEMEKFRASAAPLLADLSTPTTSTAPAMAAASNTAPAAPATAVPATAPTSGKLSAK